MSSNPFEELLVSPVAEPFSRPGDGDEHYTWDGRKYKRVTSFLDLVKGSSLGVWMAEQACFATLEPLVHAGILVPDCDTEFGLKLEKWVDARPIRVLTPHEGVLAAGDGGHNKLEGYRYRDYRAGLGQLQHHANYAFALAGRDPFQDNDIVDWAMAVARDLKIFGEGAVNRAGARGLSLEDLERDLAMKALPHIQQKFKWNNLYLPDWNMVGKGVAVFLNDQDGNPVSAGTPDDDFNLRKGVWERVGVHRWPFGDKSYPRILNDDKNTNTQSQDQHLYQVCGYARHDFIGCYDDKSVHEMPDFDAVSISYVSPDGVNYWVFNGREKIDHFANIFFHIVDLWLMMQGRPKCERRSAPAKFKPVKGSRPCPIAIGGN